ncbi:acyltransferase family protein [Agrobacterium radiobacter]|uniref:acyltransferase family protein n=1 Tax=Agrobacterium tumefaciens complex TaxID=1183400 RepID=UPI000858DFA9|nr:acyltransferase [Agrobacterium tumefaciens]NTA05423.1 acyltransferase [Agrobacterium tumefaciens]NTA92016.1 acyltransferase [Agrobacterium tumefaciens]OCJ32178.1 hypothetical protein A6U90_09685 [Agrobacterium tumefaciens]
MAIGDYGKSAGDGKLVGIQGLRFCTALLVLVFHASLFAWSSPANPHGPWEPVNQYWLTLNVGNVGVLIFFVISGYVMCLTRHSSVNTFITLRLARIYPGYLVALVLGTAMMVGGGTVRPEQISFDPSILLLPMGKSHASWSGVPYWTLNFEVYFYFITALIMLMPRQFYGWLMVAWAATLLYVYPNFPEPPDGLFGAMVWQSPYGLYFIGGALLALAKQGRHGPLSVFLTLVGVVTILAQRHQFLWQFLLLVTCLGITYSASNIRNPIDRVSKHINSMGSWSYGIYLIHFPIIFLVGEMTSSLTEVQRFTIMITVSLTGGVLFGIAEDWLYRRIVRPRVTALSKAKMLQTDQGLPALDMGGAKLAVPAGE